MVVAEFYIFLFIAMSTERFGQTFVSQTMTSLEVVGMVVATTLMCLSTRFVHLSLSVCLHMHEASASHILRFTFEV